MGRDPGDRQVMRPARYAVLRHFPGSIGRRYRRKWNGLVCQRAFDAAVARCGGKICIDLGANVGKYSRMLAAEAARVIAFEPDPWTCAALRANVADLDNVTIENAAAGVGDGEVPLYRRIGFDSSPEAYSQASSIVASKANLSKEPAVEVRQIDFIRYVEELDEEIGILKIDIEGAEVDLLEALFDRPDIMDRIAFIFAETHERFIPGHGPRVAALRRRAKEIMRPHINLDWR